MFIPEEVGTPFEMVPLEAVCDAGFDVSVGSTVPVVGEDEAGRKGPGVYMLPDSGQAVSPGADISVEEGIAETDEFEGPGMVVDEEDQELE